MNSPRVMCTTDEVWGAAGSPGEPAVGEAVKGLAASRVRPKARKLGSPAHPWVGCWPIASTKARPRVFSASAGLGWSRPASNLVRRNPSGCFRLIAVGQTSRAIVGSHRYLTFAVDDQGMQFGLGTQLCDGPVGRVLPP
jgi:hypothetical protein